MGDEVDDIFRLSDEDKKKYSTVREKFDVFLGKKGMLYSNVQMCKQEDGETVDSFITHLYALAECCGYDALHNEMIRDRLVVGLCDAEKLQLDAELTLEKALI